MEFGRWLMFQWNMLQTCRVNTVKVDTGAAFEILVIIYQTAWCHISQNCSNDLMLLETEHKLQLSNQI
jgi:hypothetical protein